MHVPLVLAFVLSLLLGSSLSDESDLLKYSKVSDEDRCEFTTCETANWEQDKCCEGYVCIMPEIYNPVQEPICANKKFLPGFGYNFGYEALGIGTEESPA